MAMSLSSEGTPDLVAFEQLVAEYQDRVYGIALRITGSAPEAEDVMQDAFLNAFRAWPSFRGEAAPTTWLYRIAVNVALQRRRSERVVEYLSEHDDADEEIVDWSPDLAQAVVQREVEQQLEAGIRRLPDDLRVALILRDVEGLSTAETSAVLAISEAAVKSRLHRARVLMRRHLGELFREG
jgi:RNA polymerase sigma-70 factor, ECF subfamily